MPDDSFHVYDTTLRDGAQQEGLNLTVADKLVIARQLDELGVGFIEGGWPGAIPKDTEFFRRAATELDLKHAQLAAFGATRRPGVKAADDPLVAALRESGAPVVTLVAKSHDRHVLLALRTTLEENLEMIKDTITHLSSNGQRVFLDAEHFFDGYKSNPDYALEVIRTAAEAGADVIALCDTNGGMLPAQLADVVTNVRNQTQARLGIHCHDDTACGVANTLTAVSSRTAASRRWPGSRTRSARSPTSPRTPTSPTSGCPRSRTRPGCMPPRSRSTPCSTSTSTPRWSATTCGCWSRTWPAGPRSS
jgi:2-isopropylmalate synthase